MAIAIFSSLYFYWRHWLPLALLAFTVAPKLRSQNADNAMREWLHAFMLSVAEIRQHGVHMYAIFLLTTYGAVYDASDDIDFI